MKTLLLFLLFATISGNTIAQTCGGLDISIANDQSGSVDATENAQSRIFIRNLSASLTLGNTNNQSRIQLSNWAETNTFSQYSFPSVGLNYTTLQSDVISYVNKPRTMNGGTDPYQALQKAYSIRSQTPIAGRTVPKIIILMTDASCFQVQSAIKTLATQIKASGTYIMVLAIQDAAACTILQGTNVASPGMYFSAASYASLAANAQTTITNMLNAACPAVPPTPVFDLSVTITSFNCGTGTVGYNVTNNGAAAFSGTLQTVFYNEDPRLITTRLLYTDTRAGQTIAAGATSGYSFTQASLIGVKNIYAIVNLSTTGTNGTPPIPINITARLLVSGEGNTVNNFSSSFAGSGCTPAPRLEVSKTASPVSCDKKVTYSVQVCNTGTADAANVAVTDVPASSNFTLVSSTFSTGYTPPGSVTTASYIHPGGDGATSGNDGIAGSYNATDHTISGSQVFGMRFPPVTAIPQGASIVSATLTYTLAGYSPTTVISITGEKSINSSIFTSASSPTTRAAGPVTSAVASSTPNNPGTYVVDMRSVIQELVSQTGWANTSPITLLLSSPLFIDIYTREWVAPAERPTLSITYQTTGGITTLSPGQCITGTFIYNAITAAAGNYDNSVGVTTATTGTIFSPNTNFTTNGVSGLNGYNGAVNSTENVTIPASTGCSQTPQPITTAVSILPANSCGGTGNYTTATVTLTNPNTSLTLNNLSLRIGVTGTGARFASEPNTFTNGLLIAEPNTLDPAYPAVSYAIYGTNGTQTIPLFTLPPGTSTFQVDIDMGSATANVTAQVTGIPITYNASGSTNIGTDANGVTISSRPVVTINTCPGTVTTAATTLNFSSNTTTNAASFSWTSSSGGSFTTGGSIASPTAVYTINAQDRANGYVDIDLRAINGSCDADALCRVLITGATYDFGDLPSSYDLLQTGQPYVAGALISSGTIKLGSLAPDGEALPQANVSATGDNFDNTNDEDGVLFFPGITLGMTTYNVTVTASNTSGGAATLIGWIDWNNNNQFEPSEAAAPVTVPNGTNGGSFILSWASITPTLGMWGRARFRIADALTIYDYIGVTANGEVEDYTILNFVLPLTLTNFTAAKQNNHALLSWTTSSEQNSAYFKIEHSKDGMHFNPIGMVAAAGNSNSPHDYHFTHNDPATGANYYRLKIMDVNGEFVYSAIRVLNIGNAGSVIIVYPNPAKDKITVTGIEPGMRLQVFAADGWLKATYTARSTTEMIPVEKLASGLYIIQVFKEKIVSTLRFIKK
ncbi:MAG: GEVED domain-containing protein [Chitinophagaceae bacterium]